MTMPIGIKEFVNQLCLLYPNSLKNADEFLIKKQYFAAIDEKGIDYDLLMDRVAKYHNSDFAPPPAWLREQLKFCYSKEFKENLSGYIHVKVFDPRYKSERNIDCFPLGTTDEAIIKTYEKMFNCKGWKILNKV